MKKFKIAFILGIRPDIIRASLILKYLNSYPDIESIFIWSGQHYSDNLKAIFFRELGVKPPAIELGCGGEEDSQIVSCVISKLSNVLRGQKPDVAVFLGDNNTNSACIAAALQNIPIIHIEGGMRSYDWRMPEEKYRTIVDHLSDLIYVYLDEYKTQAVREGLNPKNIVVVGNPIVDILEQFYFKRKAKFDQMASFKFFKSRNITKDRYLVMTCHRRENVHDPKSFLSIINLIKKSPYKIYFPASYRTQRVIKEMNIKVADHVIVVDPVGYEELITLMVNSRGVITDSGTVVEEASILEIPAIQIRKSTERPQVYDVGGCVKFDPTNPQKYDPLKIYKKLDSLRGKHWKHILGDGKASKRIAKDIRKRLLHGGIRGHEPKFYHIPTDRSFREDGI